MDGQQTPAAVVPLRAGVDTLLAQDLTRLPSAELVAMLAAQEVQRRRQEAVDQRLIAEIAERRLAGDYGRTSTADLLVTMLRVSPAEAKARVGRAQDLGPRRAMTGEPLQPILPIAAAAVAAGEISAAQVAVISECLDAIPAAISHEVVPVAEAMLVEAARHENPKLLRQTAALLLARIDPDGIEPREQWIERSRGFGLRKHRDGSATPTGILTAELTALLDAVLDSLAAPIPAQDGLPDDRTPAQRRHDGLAEAMHRLLRSATLPPAGGAPVTILARTSTTDLAAGSGLAITSHGDPLPISTLLAMSGDAILQAVVCDATGGILSYGRKRRLASRGQRLALIARDGGCSFPGCNRPAAWTEVHHIKTWLNGGHTDLANMCLLCRYHHREFEPRGWQILMINGTPWWRPPTWYDPHRKPIRNTTHHLDDITFNHPAAS